MSQHLVKYCNKTITIEQSISNYKSMTIACCGTINDKIETEIYLVCCLPCNSSMPSKSGSTPTLGLYDSDGRTVTKILMNMAFWCNYNLSNKRKLIQVTWFGLRIKFPFTH